MSVFNSKNNKKTTKTSFNEILNLMTKDSNNPKTNSFNEILHDRRVRKYYESNCKIYHSPKNSFERNYNKLFKEFKSTDFNSDNSSDIQTAKNKRQVRLESEEKIHLKALQSKIQSKSKTKKDVKTKLKKMKIGCLTENLIHEQIPKPIIKEESSHRKFYSSENIPKSIVTEVLVKTQSKLIKNDFISDKMKTKMIDIYKKANQSNMTQNESNKNSMSLLSEYSSMPGYTPIGQRQISFNTSNYSLNNINEFGNSHRSFLESSPNRIKVKLVKKEITSLLNGSKEKDGVISKIKSIVEDNLKKSNGIKTDYKTFLNFDSWNSNNQEIMSKIIKKFPDVVKSKNSLGLKRLVSISK